MAGTLIPATAYLDYLFLIIAHSFHIPQVNSYCYFTQDEIAASLHSSQ